MGNLKELITKETGGEEDDMKVMASADKDKHVVICSLDDCEGEAVMYCTTCHEYMCQTCTEEHAIHRFTRKHDTIAATEAIGKTTSSSKSHHPCGRHPNHMLEMYCKTCEDIICHVCCKIEHIDHNFTTLSPFVKPCEIRLNVLIKRIDKLLKCVDLASQTSREQVHKAQNHILTLKTQVSITFKHIKDEVAQQEERLMSDLERVAIRVDKVASSTQDQQQLAEANLRSLRYLGDSLLTEGDVYDQLRKLPSLEEAVEKRWRTDIPVIEWLYQSCQDQMKTKLHNVDHLTLTETYCTTCELPRFETDSDTVPNLEGATVSDKPSCLDWSNDNTKVQCLEEKAYSETLPHLEKFKICENIFGLQEDSDNDTLLVLDGDTGDDRTSSPDCNTHNNNVSHLEGYATGLDASLTCASYDKSNENSSDSGEFINFNVGGLVSGICSHNNTIFLVKRFDNSLYMYRSTGELENKHIILE